MLQTVDELHFKLIDMGRRTKEAREYIKANGLDAYTERSSCAAGSNAIVWLGRYKDPEQRSISFFHEVGHLLLPPDYHWDVGHNSIICEVQCWQLGLRFAYRKGLSYSDAALRWGYQQALTYRFSEGR